MLQHQREVAVLRMLSSPLLIISMTITTITTTITSQTIIINTKLHL